jgi:hypothetical protein
MDATNHERIGEAELRRAPSRDCPPRVFVAGVFVADGGALRFAMLRAVLLCEVRLLMSIGPDNYALVRPM